MLPVEQVNLLIFVVDLEYFGEHAALHQVHHFSVLLDPVLGGPDVNIENGPLALDVIGRAAMYLVN